MDAIWLGRISRAAALLVATSVLLAGCGEPDRAEVTVGRQTFRVEVARSAQQQRTGLAGRDRVPAGTGMLFEFSSRGTQQVWMADTRVPLDVAWIVDDRLLAVRTLQPCTAEDADDCPRWTSPEPVDAMLEVPAGALVDLQPGTPITVRELADD